MRHKGSRGRVAGFDERRLGWSWKYSRTPGCALRNKVNFSQNYVLPLPYFTTFLATSLEKHNLGRLDTLCDTYLESSKPCWRAVLSDLLRRFPSPFQRCGEGRGRPQRLDRRRRFSLHFLIGFIGLAVGGAAMLILIGKD
ncbi:hypothetical protein NDU88_006989 [Pleurodeles waltl]|uniref:Uncharacterized protein n=1 Tax=Pleurodeles waltl TaxID=8319 RepID=A0AAV7N318_PLEWA|nr:hypothetical protein NDU88_006989 [Pleurodeles waltl]